MLEQRIGSEAIRARLRNAAWGGNAHGTAYSMTGVLPGREVRHRKCAVDRTHTHAVQGPWAGLHGLEAVLVDNDTSATILGIGTLCHTVGEEDASAVLPVGLWLPRLLMYVA
jgi:hypothetical protein